MNRLLKILLYAVVLFFLFLWISTLFKSCGAESTDTDTKVEQIAEESSNSDDFFEEGGSSNTDVAEETTPTETGNNVDYSELDEVVEKNTTPPSEIVSDSAPAKVQKPKPSTPARSTNTQVNSGNSKGRYMVIAGSYLVKDNANRMKRRLKDLGYNQSDIVVFDLSQYHSVIAARYSSYDKALRTSNELKRRGVDCYVHAQQN